MSRLFDSVTIIGCGWFGTALAKSLLAQGVFVTGTRRSVQGVEELKQLGVNGVRLDLIDTSTQSIETAQELTADVLVVSIPPGFRHGQNNYYDQLVNLSQLIDFSQFNKLVFISSTGVYPNETGEYDESAASPHSPSAEAILKAEALFLAYSQGRVCRFAGLVGPKRHPGRFFAGKTDVSGAQASVNLVHQDDCVQAVLTLLNARESAQIYNVCAPNHPSKKEFYTLAAIDLGLTPPVFNQVTGADKRVNGDKLIKDLGYRYRYSDPKAMLVGC